MKDYHLFFDLDHTLWDFETNSKETLKLIFNESGLNEQIKEFSSFHMAYKNVNRKLWRMYGVGQLTKEVLRSKRFIDTLSNFNIKDEALAEKLSQDYLDISPYQKNLFPGAIKMLDGLKSQNYQMHIITNGFKEVQHIKLREAGLKPYFDIIVCSEEVGVNKPNPLVFNHAMEKAGVLKDKSVMIGDDYHVDYRGALDAGMKAVFFNHRGNQKIRKGDVVINQLSELQGRLSLILRD